MWDNKTEKPARRKIPGTRVDPEAVTLLDCPTFQCLVPSKRLILKFYLFFFTSLRFLHFECAFKFVQICFFSVLMIIITNNLITNDIMTKMFY